MLSLDTYNVKHNIMKAIHEMSERELNEGIYEELKKIRNSNSNMLTWVNVWSILIIIVLGIVGFINFLG